MEADGVDRPGPAAHSAVAGVGGATEMMMKLLWAGVVLWAIVLHVAIAALVLL
jgi:hypothetical protein